jgi:hypothetical protein
MSQSPWPDGTALDREARDREGTSAMGMTKMEHRLYAALIAAWTRGFRLWQLEHRHDVSEHIIVPATDEDIADRW